MVLKYSNNLISEHARGPNQGKAWITITSGVSNSNRNIVKRLDIIVIIIEGKNVNKRLCDHHKNISIYHFSKKCWQKVDILSLLLSWFTSFKRYFAFNIQHQPQPPSPTNIIFVPQNLELLADFWCLFLTASIMPLKFAI